MIVDSSALIAVLLLEPDAERLLTVLGRYGGSVSAATLVEARVVAASKNLSDGAQRLDSLIRRFALEIVPFDHAQADAATAAYRSYGRGSGHAAQLNLGDAFSYALAYVLDEPLLYVGDDFSRTDIRSALAEYGDE